MYDPRNEQAAMMRAESSRAAVDEPPLFLSIGNARMASYELVNKLRRLESRLRTPEPKDNRAIQSATLEVAMSPGRSLCTAVEQISECHKLVECIERLLGE